jgi:hypothetical protein
VAQWARGASVVKIFNTTGASNMGNPIYGGAGLTMFYCGDDADAKKIAAVGQDSLDWKKIFTTAKTGGIKNYFVEMDLDLMKASVPYLRNLEV